MYDDSGLGGRFGSGRIYGMQPHSFRIDDKGVFQRSGVQQAVHPLADVRIFVAHVAVGTLNILSVIGLRIQRIVEHIETRSSDDCNDHQQWS